MKNYVRSTIDFYDKNINEYVAKTSDLHDDIWIEKFVSLLPKDGKILDIGCAFGRDVNIFIQKGFNAIGVDLSSNMIAKAQSLYPKAKFKVMDMMSLDFKDDTFDGIWCSATLLHLTKNDAIIALREMNRVLKNKGYLYLNLKEGQGEKTIADNRYRDAKKFYSYYTVDEIKKVLSDNKFFTKDIKSIVDENDQYRDTGIIYLIAQKNYIA
ncbi:class I SAM-dependent methyltransferase [Patescibacteria group bacterium]|nr:class I SAM-dependent methyltransferase [Patescibacteria group bacterium]MBU4368820.1 class I SAM-dependent methyltransferase [Patescibacteria group bacterium]